MPTLQLPARPEILFGVWDRNGNPVTQNNGRGGQVGYRIWPTYHGYSYVRANRNDIDPRWLASEMSYYSNNVRRLILNAIDMASFLTGKRIVSIAFDEERWGGYPRLRIRIEGCDGEIVLKSNRYNYSYRSSSVDLPATEGPWEVKRWLKTGKTIRLVSGEGITLNFYGKLKFERVPDQLLEELFGQLPPP